MDKAVKVVFAGEGGQGVQLAGELLADAAYGTGLETVYIPNFGVEQRGGVSIAFVQVSKEPIGAPKFARADILVVLSPRSVERTRGYLKPGTIYIYESSSIQAPVIDDQAVGIQGYDTVAPEVFGTMVGNHRGRPAAPPRFPEIRPVGIPAAEIAKTEFTPRVFNIIILGLVAELLGMIPLERVREALDRKLGSKFTGNPSLRELNYKALERGAGYSESLMAGAWR